MSHTKPLAFSGLAIALATIISTFIKLPSLPNGGSVTLGSMLIICLAGFAYGPRHGIITGIAYGCIQFMLEPFAVHPLQVLLDYPLAFGALGLAGVFRSSRHGLYKGYILAVCARLCCHQLSGMLFFVSYVGSVSENLQLVLAALLYNASYILTEAALTLAFISLPGVKTALERLTKQ